MKPCEHENAIAGCLLCDKYESDSQYKWLCDSRKLPPLTQPGFSLAQSFVAPEQARPAPCKGCMGEEDFGRELLPGTLDPIRDDELQPVPPGWAHEPLIQQLHIAALRDLLRRDFRPPARAEGDGVLICGGDNKTTGHNFWPMIALSVRMLRDVSDLPVQIWYRPTDERIYPDELADVAGVTYHNAEAVEPKPRICRGWEVKTIALAHCGWRRVVYIDADAYCVADPAPLLSLVSDGWRFIFWSDMPHTQTNVNWSAYGIGNIGMPQVQGGQFVIDRVAFWRELCISHWLNQHSDYFFSHQYGDQDSWLVALTATRGQHLSLGPAPWHHPAFVCPFNGTPVFVHRCRGKLWGRADDKPAMHLPRERRVFELLAQRPTLPAPETFRQVYAAGVWGQGIKSGTGSIEREARPYLNLVNKLIAERGWTRVVDLGCGDGWITSQLQAAERIGVECVEPLPGWERGPGVEWLTLDLDRQRDELPAGDVALLKDLLHHWPTSLIRDWLAWARASGKWRALVLTNDRLQTTDDCRLGGYRGLDPAKAPLAELPVVKVADYLHKTILVMECSNNGDPT